MKGYTYTPIMLVAAKVDGEKFEFAGMTQAVEKEKWFKSHLTPGKYVIYVRSNKFH